MLELDEAVARMLAAVQPIAEIQASLTFDALGRVLAADQASAVDVPPLDNSAMDGYAVRSADVPEAGALLPVSQRIAAGAVGTPLAEGTAARIFTGAPVPLGADAVVMQEQCEVTDGGVRVMTVPASGLAIRRRGEDVAVGQVVLVRGTRLTPQALGVAASVGLAELPVWRRPRVALLSTGDELAMPGEPLKPGGIYNSNRYTLRGLIQAGGADCVDLGIVPDQLEATRVALREAAAGCDLIVSSGGVSVGEEDHLKAAVQAEGALDLWQVAIKPGKPLAFGRVGSALFVGLPGNPVASFVTFLLAVRPVLRKLAGEGGEGSGPRALDLPAAFDWSRPDRYRREFLRARRSPEGVELFPNQGSGVLTAVHWADGLVDLPAGREVSRGETVRFIPFAEWGVA